MISKKLKLHASCVPVKGYSRSIICDLHRNSYSIVPSDLYDMLILHEGKCTDEIKKSYNNLYDEVIDEYIEFLLKNEYCFFTSTPQYYQALQKDWHYPFEISNAIWDYNQNFNIHDILRQLDALHCKNLEVRMYEKADWDAVNSILSALRDMKSIIGALGLIMPYDPFLPDDLQTVTNANTRISYIYFFNTPPDVAATMNGQFKNIYFFKDIVESETHCGLVHPKSFIVNIKNFTESQKYNSCLNKKISIDKEGNIKNCPSMQNSYGNIKDMTLRQALDDPNFKTKWNTTKDQINECKDCEFRYICTDCRAYVAEPEDIYSKPLKCGYNPYTNVWEDWSKNQLKNNAIQYYKFGIV